MINNTPRSTTRYKRPLSDAFQPNSPKPKTPSRDTTHANLRRNQKNDSLTFGLGLGYTSQIAIHNTAAEAPTDSQSSATATNASVTAATSAAAAAAATATEASTPWYLSVREGLDFCRDGEALLQQLQDRIHSTADQLVRALPLREGETGEGDESNRESEEDDTKRSACSRRTMNQQLHLEEEIKDCLKEIRELRGWLVNLESIAESNALLAERSGEGDMRSAAKTAGSMTALETVKLFKLNEVLDDIAGPPAQAMAAVLRSVKRVVAALADRIHQVENSSSVWMTHAAEVLPYLLKLQQSLDELTREEQTTKEKIKEVMTRVSQKRKEEERVRFRLAKTQDDFRLARLDLTRDELEKISGEERMKLLENKREALDRELKSLAAFSPLFIVERAAKYITLQYRPENSEVDHEISIEGLDLSFTGGATRISPFFAVHVQPPNDRVRLLLESGIGDLMKKLSVSDVPTQETEQKKTNRTGGQAIDPAATATEDFVVEYIAAVLIKTLSASFTAPKPSPLHLSLLQDNTACRT